MKEWYRISEKEVLKEMQGSPEGLTTGQAEQIRSQVGENALKEGARKKAWQVFLEQFKDLLVIILIVAAVISMLSDNMESTIVIFAVIIMNAILGTVQHEKAQKSLHGEKALYAATARVMRDSCQTENADPGFFNVCGRFGGCSDPGGSRINRYDRAGHGYPEDGKGTCDHQGFKSGGEPGLRIGHLLRQDGNPDPEQDDGAAGLCGRRGAAAIPADPVSSGAQDAFIQCGPG